MDTDQHILPQEDVTILKLSEVASRIRDAVGREFGSGLHWITAEISELSVRKGHCYIHLVEKSPGAAAPLCEMKGIIWSSKFKSINNKFLEGTGSELANGHVIMFRSSIRYDVKWGLSLVIDDIEPAFTLGLIEKERAATVSKLKQEGVYGHNRGLEFPVAPQKIALISARDSRGYEDFTVKLDNNKYGYRYNVTLFQSRLQGDAAADEIVSALINIFKQIRDFDLVVIVRGGGGSVDLNCFNDLRLSRAVARFPVPVITGIGHTSNVSVVDEVAFASRITPTDAADHIIEESRSFENRMEDLLSDIRHHCIEKLINEDKLLNSLASGISGKIREQLEHQQKDLNFMAKMIHTNVSGTLKSASSVLRNRSEYISRITGRSIEEAEALIGSRSQAIVRNVNEICARQMDRVDRIFELAGIHSTNRISAVDQKLAGHHDKLESLDPVNVLKRGYTITLRNNKLMKGAGQTDRGDKIKTIFYDGEIESEIR